MVMPSVKPGTRLILLTSWKCFKKGLPSQLCPPTTGHPHTEINITRPLLHRLYSPTAVPKRNLQHLQHQMLIAQYFEERKGLPELRVIQRETEFSTAPQCLRANVSAILHGALKVQWRAKNALSPHYNANSNLRLASTSNYYGRTKQHS